MSAEVIALTAFTTCALMAGVALAAWTWGRSVGYDAGHKAGYKIGRDEQFIASNREHEALRLEIRELMLTHDADTAKLAVDMTEDAKKWLEISDFV